MNNDLKTDDESTRSEPAEDGVRSSEETPHEDFDGNDGKDLPAPYNGDVEPHTDERLAFLIPSVAALCFAITALLTHFGNVLVDLNNTCYYIYVNAGKLGEAEFIDTIESIMDKRPSLSGYTIQKNLLGGYRSSSGKLVREDNSYLIILMDVSLHDIEIMAHEIYRTLDSGYLLIEEVVMNSYYMNSDKKLHRWKDMLHELGS